MKSDHRRRTGCVRRDVERLVDRRPQRACAGVLGVRHDGRRRDRRCAVHRRHRHAIAIAAAQHTVGIVPHDVYELRVAGLRRDRVDRRIHRQRLPRVVHHREKIVCPVIRGGRDEDEISVARAAGDIAEIDRHIRVAVAALLLMDEAERVAEFVGERGAVPARRADIELLHAADHADGGVAAGKAGPAVVDHHVVRLRSARDEVEIRKCRPLAHRIERRGLVRGADVHIERIIHVAAGPFVDASLGTAGLHRPGKLIPPKLHRRDRDHHVAEGDRRLTLIDAGEDGIIRRHSLCVRTRWGVAQRAEDRCEQEQPEGQRRDFHIQKETTRFLPSPDPILRYRNHNAVNSGASALHPDELLQPSNP